MKATILLFVCSAFLAACVSGGVAFQCYVVINPDETAKLIGAVSSIAKDDGLETAIAQRTPDTGKVLSVIEGRGHGLKLWMQNIPLSGREDPKLCGVHQEAYVDPAQFVISTQPRLFETDSSRAAAVELGEKVFSQLKSLGFDVRREPVVCGAAVTHHG